MDDMGDANILLKFREKKNERRERERELYLVTFFFRFKLCHKTSFQPVK